MIVAGVRIDGSVTATESAQFYFGLAEIDDFNCVELRRFHLSDVLEASRLLGTRAREKGRDRVHRFVQDGRSTLRS